MNQRHMLEDYATRRVSFVLTTRDRAQFIGRALEMARQLVGPDDELIVVDGASTDGTAEIIANYGDLVDIFISEPDANPSHALNKGILLAHGKYIKHLTDDDEFFSNPMEQAIAVFEAHPEVDLLLCGGTRQLDGVISPVYVPPGVNYGKSPEDVFRYGVCGCGTFIRRSAIPRIGLTDQSNAASDGEYIARAIHNGAQVRFCRVNLFRHPIYAHSYIIAHERVYRRDVDWVVRQYCSRAFYLKFRLKNTILRNRVLRGPALAVRDALRTVLAMLGSKRSRARLSPEEPVWDGGFS